MKRALPWILMPLAMMAFCLLPVVVIARQLHAHRVSGLDDVDIYVTNSPACSWFEYSRDLTNWYTYFVLAQPEGKSWPLLSLTVTPSDNMVFLRLRDCAAP